jgi:uncharacterized protein (TIGR03032 family)
MSQTLQPFSCIYSPNVPELLTELGCSLVISTYQAGKLVFISAKDKTKLVQLGKTIQKPMGVAFDGERLAVAGKDNVFLFSSAPLLAKGYARQPDTYDNIFLPRAQYYTSLLDIHDLVWINDKLLMVNTRFSCLCWLDNAYNFLPFWKPEFITALMPEDRCHLNGVAIKNNKPAFVSMLGVSDEPAGWRNKKTNGGVIIDVDSGEIVLNNLAMPHTPRIINDALYVLLSASGELIRVDINSGKFDIIKKFGGYVRGMAYYKGFLFVAYSKIREKSSAFSDLPIAATSKEAGIGIMHFESGNIVGEIKYQNSVEEIYDLQLIANTRPGMINFDQQEKDLAISLPGTAFWGVITEEK